MSTAARADALVDAVAPTLRGLLAGDGALPIVVFDDAPGAAASPAPLSGVAGAPGAPVPITGSGPAPLVVDLRADLPPDDVLPLLQDRLAAHAAAHGAAPEIVIVPGLGLFAAGPTWYLADAARRAHLGAAAAVEVGAPTVPAASGRFAGKVAVVTGAAQGFGLGIAADLVAEGGHVVLADLNVALAEARARELEERHGPGRASAIVADVTDEGSVAGCIHETVRRYGGLDVLVSNAGVLRAGAVTSQPLPEFDLVTAVNYRGYFLAVRAAAPVMSRQHRARPDRWFDIIEINSKSGLVGSRRNSAYAGSKFGGIGLTQSFALELVGDGIKVNAICPGNFFDGPLWSDPDHGLFVQYLREGKVPGARTVEDVRRAYEAKVPMGRGCTPADVLEAIHYVVAQRYETGQALPVTGGQVMLA